MKLGIFFFYFIVLFFIFLSSRKKGKPLNLRIIIVLPALFALVLSLLSVIKLYVIYKILFVIIGAVLILFSYWQWKDKFRRWL
ncbi:hypothetical protein Sgly_2063 [Syntrophobotulus glycolicus DSM 8271]|uniref:Uncharacterized protein n=1 Tax=Syntrophobotulus glycolicus (strain DSM 8271 / FlGlyR) TaxID=645991 RepID=F0T212_SYNGF|nr:hypothetical protein [Syntrophobotulus glycolicus]ADY56356.1 hypothetical protein Sgly_2063 [Syntrophobotulus glycolicus DSM 8271]